MNELTSIAISFLCGLVGLFVGIRFNKDGHASARRAESEARQADSAAAAETEHRASEIFRLMIDAVKEYAIFMLDPNGNIMTWNAGAQRLKGYTADEIVGKHFSIFYPEEALARDHPANELKLAVENGQYTEEGWRKRKDGTMFWASVTITPLLSNDGILYGFTKVTRDMTDRREMEREVELQRDKAIEASALKSAFVANISHEIRTPLAGILGMNELLLQTDLNEEQLEYARVVQNSSQSLLTVLNDVLDLSKVEAGKMQLENIPFNVSFTTQDATRLMSAAAKNKGLTLTHRIDTRIPDLLVGDPERLRQVLLNLVGNAVKFTQVGDISVIAELLDEGKDSAKVKFSVTDSGIGIGPDESKHIFVPFAQVDASSTRKFGGTGLGLTISKHLVELMHGEIGFESEKGVGSTFWFTVPFPKTMERREEAEQAAKQAVSGEPLVLIVEDNNVLQDLTVKQLLNLGIKSVVVDSGVKALDVVMDPKLHFDMILMDVHLPEMDGYQTTEAIRKVERQRGTKTPIVAMTARAMKGDREKALAAGMDDYLSKPVTLETLRQKCQMWIRKQKASKEQKEIEGST